MPGPPDLLQHQAWATLNYYTSKPGRPNHSTSSLGRPELFHRQRFLKSATSACGASTADSTASHADEACFFCTARRTKRNGTCRKCAPSRQVAMCQDCFDNPRTVCFFFVPPTTLIFELTRNYVATSHKCHIKFVSLSHWATSHKCAPSQWGLRLRRSQHLRGRDAQPCGGDAS